MSGWEMGGRQATKLRKSSARSAALPPCFLRGDPAFLTPEMTAARAALKHDPQVVEVIQTFWMNFALSPHNEAGREEYCRVYMLIARSMLAVFDTSDACDAAEAAYRAHSAHADGVTFAAFHSFLFGLADVWTADVSAAAYASFISRLLVRVTSPTNPPVPRLMAYRMSQVVAGVEDTTATSEVPACPEAANWADLENVYPMFLFGARARVPSSLSAPPSRAAWPQLGSRAHLQLTLASAPSARPAQTTRSGRLLWR
jgi:hypothetical protein